MVRIKLLGPGAAAKLSGSHPVIAQLPFESKSRSVHPLPAALRRVGLHPGPQPIEADFIVSAGICCESHLFFGGGGREPMSSETPVNAFHVFK